jgi:hypothetical protein
MKNASNFKTLREISKDYSLPLTTLRRWASERRFPIYKISNRIRVSELEFRDWIENFKVEQGE